MCRGDQRTDLFLTSQDLAAAVRQRLLQWARSNLRSFPWRETRDPYRILVAEVLLHRTRVQQVMAVYPEFLQRFPDVSALAAASPAEVLELLKPLGLHWRSRLLHEMARRILQETGGQILPDREWLRALPGVSDYIASAVLCLAFGRPEPMIDTNTVRVVSRILGTAVTDGTRRSRWFREMCERLLDRDSPAVFNLALIDLGAAVCRPAQPSCAVCPLCDLCAWAAEGSGKKEHA